MYFHVLEILKQFRKKQNVFSKNRKKKKLEDSPSLPVLDSLVGEESKIL